MSRERSAHSIQALRQVLRATGVSDRIGFGTAIAVPVLLYLPFTLAGHPLVPGDDLTQNYPLRELVGALVRSGHFPAWDPFIWSGTALLAGWNAGAMYPGTLLFAVLPGIAAWTLNLVLVGVVCATGVYVLLRLLGCRPLAGTLGALCFTYTGSMSGQLNHIGLVEGTGYVGWMLVAIELLARRPSGKRHLPVLLLATTTALSILAGEPRAISSDGIIAVVYLFGRCIGVDRTARWRYLVGGGLGLAFGVGISAVQWVPGLTFLSGSQRTLDAYHSFGAGSLDWLTIGHLLLVPFLLGGNGNLGLPAYQGGYNLPELTIGVGLLPLVGAFAYFPILARQGCVALGRRIVGGARRVGRHSVDQDGSSVRRLGVWYAIGVVGLLLTLGTTTPIGHALVHIPLFSGERLQNRNAVIFDLPLAVILGFFIDDLVASGRQMVSRTATRLAPLARWWHRLFALAPIGACLALITIAYLHPMGLERHLGVGRPTANLFVRLAPYLGFTSAVAIGAALLVLVDRRLSPRVRAVVLAVLTSCDIAVYIANASYGTAQSAVLAGATSTHDAISADRANGRIAVYNPLDVAPPEASSTGSKLLPPDLNVLRDLPSVQGYGSIVSGTYQAVTDTHDLDDLDLTMLHNGTANALNLRALLTLPIYLQDGLPAHTPIPASGVPPSSADTPSTPPMASGPWRIASGASEQWYLAAPAKLQSVTIVVNAVSGTRPAAIEVGVAGAAASGPLETVPVLDGEAHLVLRAPDSAERIIVRSVERTPLTVGAVVVTKSPAERLLLSGALQGSLTSPQWSYAGKYGPYAVFVNADADGTAWLEPVSSKAPTEGDPSLGHATTTIDRTTGAEATLTDTSRAALLVRSVAYQSGWSAEIEPLSGGQTQTLPAQRLGLVQAVVVPAGRYRIIWHYAPRGLLVGILASFASLLAALVLLVLARCRSTPSLPGRLAL